MNPIVASSHMVNRAHRVVREQAIVLREQRSRKRSLWAPLAICSTLLLLLSYAMWGMLDIYDLTPTGIPDASAQIFLLLLWSLPVTALLLGVAYLRRERVRNNGGLPR